MKSLCLIHRSIRKQIQLTEHEYHKHRPRKVLFFEHVYFVQICPVFAGSVTNNDVIDPLQGSGYAIMYICKCNNAVYFMMILVYVNLVCFQALCNSHCILSQYTYV